MPTISEIQQRIYEPLRRKSSDAVKPTPEIDATPRERSYDPRNDRSNQRYEGLDILV